MACATAWASTAAAQTKQPIGRLAIDARAASVGLPIIEGWTPTLPEGTQVPARALGLEVGAHVYIARFRGGAIGVGGTWMTGRGTASPPDPPAGTTVPPDEIDPTVTTRLTSLSPQLSLNFGHALGWSYLSAGFGRSRVESAAAAAPRSTLRYTPADSGWVTTLNFGGGARWFVNDRVGVTLDLRWRRLRGRDPGTGRLATPPTTLLTVGAGVSIK